MNRGAGGVTPVSFREKGIDALYGRRNDEDDKKQYKHQKIQMPGI